MFFKTYFGDFVQDDCPVSLLHSLPVPQLHILCLPLKSIQITFCANRKRQECSTAFGIKEGNCKVLTQSKDDSSGSLP